jgi:hypothetical protein
MRPNGKSLPNPVTLVFFASNFSNRELSKYLMFMCLKNVAEIDRDFYGS